MIIFSYSFYLGKNSIFTSGSDSIDIWLDNPPDFEDLFEILQIIGDNNIINDISLFPLFIIYLHFSFVITLLMRKSIYIFFPHTNAIKFFCSCITKEIDETNDLFFGYDQTKKSNGTSRSFPSKWFDDAEKYEISLWFNSQTTKNHFFYFFFSRSMTDITWRS